MILSNILSVLSFYEYSYFSLDGELERLWVTVHG